MTAAEYRKLEVALVAADDLFVSDHVYGRRALEIRDEVKNLLSKVIAERIQTEERERTQSPQPRVVLKAPPSI